MRHSTLNIVVAALASGLLPTASLAQSPPPCGIGATGVFVYPSYAKTITPFSATVQTTHDQKLADGNSIHGMIVTHFYQDSSGRTRSESSTLCGAGLDGQFLPTINVTIYDTKNHTTMNWRINGDDKVARIIHQEAHPLYTPPPLTPEQRALNAAVQQHRSKNTRTEKLPDSDIAGVSCQHTRTVFTTPAGEQGNELPMESTSELCIAYGIGLTMLRSSDDPLSGRTKTEVTEFSPGEPDPSVFIPPPGYTIEEQPPSR